MSNKEAINLLKQVNHILVNDDDYWTKNTHEPLNTAFSMAIKALEQESVLDKIRADVIARYPKNYAGEPELGGNACEFSLNEILKILDKYKAEMER